MLADDEPTHPSYKIIERISMNGLKPYSLDEQWEHISDWHAFLRTDKADDYPVLSELNESWAELEFLYTHDGKCFIERGAELKRTANSPLSALFYFIDMGFYPPPELLLTLLDCWETYTASSGKITLEEAFLGRVVQKSGNYAQRANLKLKRSLMFWEFNKKLREGLDRTRAAEAVSEIFGGSPEPESILRMFRGHKPYRKEKAEK